MTDLDRTWLVQRLNKPYPHHSILGADNPFAFGGGLRHGGLSKDAMDLLRPIFSFDYMGAAEFEFGAIPEALSGLAKSHENLTAGSFDIALADVQPGWREKGAPPADAVATVYFLCRGEQSDAVEKRIRELAAKDFTLKEATHLPSTLRPSSEYDGRTVGWLELNNGFMFFTDRDMWSATCALFGVAVEVSS